MGSQPSPAPKVAFGPFEFDSASGELRKYGHRVRLQGQPLQILSILIEQPGHVISREELQRQLWQGAKFGDLEQGLNAAVNKMRQALGDSADQPRFVETVPGRGYRFVAPVQFAGTKPVLEMAPPVPIRLETAPGKPGRRWLPWAAGAALAVVGISSYWLGTRRAATDPVHKPARLVVTPPSGFALEAAASRQSFALSPDGKRLAFSAMSADGAFHVFLQDLGSLEPRLLAASERVHTMFWPPDGQSLFLTVNGKLQWAPLEGDARLVLGDTPPFLLSGAWLRPDKVVLSSRSASYTVSASGGMLEPGNDVCCWPQVLPGERVLHTIWDSRAGRHRARIAPYDQSAPAKDLVESDSRVMYTESTVSPGTGYLLYVRSGNLVAHPFDAGSLRAVGEAVPIVSNVYSFFPAGAADFSVSDRGVIAYRGYAGRSQLVWVDREGRQLGTIGPSRVNLKAGRLSPDGRWLATAIYNVERGAQDLWLLDAKTGAGRRLGIGPGVSDSPVWSPDSKKLAFLHSFDGKRPRLGIRGIGETDTEVVIPGEGFRIPTDWSPDGRFITFVNTGLPRFANETRSDVWLVDTRNDYKVIPLVRSPFHEANAAFSPDGKWLAFTSDESGQTEVYLQAFQTGDSPTVVGERYLVSRAGAQALRWRRDGKELFYLAFDGRVHAVPVRLSTKPELGAVEPLFSISTDARAAVHSLLGFDLSRDGKRFVIPVVDSTQASPLVVLQNWEAQLLRH